MARDCALYRHGALWRNHSAGVTQELPTRIYLDHAATTPMLPAAMAAVEAGMRGWANPSSPHAEGRAARAALEQARARIAAAHGWSGETLLTSGASEALSIALGRATPPGRLIGATEHDGVIRAAPGAGTVPVGPSGLLDLDRLTALLSGGAPALVAVQWANSETGVRQPTEEIASIVHAAGGLLLVDAAQMPAGADPTLAGHADFVALSSHKRGGPPGVGALLVRDLATLEPSGGQERGYRAGTENVPGVLGYAAALEQKPDMAHWAAMRARLDDAVQRSGGEVVGAAAPRHPAIGSYRMPGVVATVQLIRLDLAGISVSAGSACSSGSMKPSHVLAAMGWREPVLREVVRVSFGAMTSDAEIDAFITAWRAIAREARSRAA